MQIIIDNPSLEAQLIKRSKELKIKVDQLIEKLLSDKIEEQQTFHYRKKNPFENIKKLEYNDSNEDATNPFENIDDVVGYSKKLRNSAWR